MKRVLPKKRMLIIVLILLGLIVLSVYWFQHSIYYKYNNTWIIGRTVDDVRVRYGEFDYETRKSVGYYIYSGSPWYWFFSDNLDRYYYMDIDENGFINDIYVSVQRGG